jgi:hypothetical protein
MLIHPINPEKVREKVFGQNLMLEKTWNNLWKLSVEKINYH